MSDAELATEQERQEVLTRLRAFLDHLEELEAKWRSLPENKSSRSPSWDYCPELHTRG
jgi:hypothetical protein